jgi:hypothetical protein
LPKLDPEHARALAQDLTEALPALQRLRVRLQQRDAAARTSLPLSSQVVVIWC